MSKRKIKCPECKGTGRGFVRGSNTGYQCPKCKGKKTIQNPDICFWEYNEWDDYFETGCGECFCIEAGILKDNKFRFCIYCGKEIEEVLKSKMEKKK